MSLVNPNRNQAQQSCSNIMVKYYITFGQLSPFKNGWVEIYAKDEYEAKQYANDYIGKWSMCYTEEPSLLTFPKGRIGIILNASVY